MAGSPSATQVPLGVADHLHLPSSLPTATSTRRATGGVRSNGYSAATRNDSKAALNEYLGSLIAKQISANRNRNGKRNGNENENHNAADNIIPNNPDLTALLLETRKLQTLRALQAALNRGENDIQDDINRDNGISMLKSSNVVVPNPSEQECSAMLAAKPELVIVRETSHTILPMIARAVNCRNHNVNAGEEMQSGANTDCLRTTSPVLDKFLNLAREDNLNKEENPHTIRSFRGFDIVWLDYCGTFNSRAGRQRKQDLRYLVRGKLLSAIWGASGNPNQSENRDQSMGGHSMGGQSSDGYSSNGQSCESDQPSSNRNYYSTRNPSIVAVTLSTRGATPLYEGELVDKLILFFENEVKSIIISNSTVGVGCDLTCDLLSVIKYKSGLTCDVLSVIKYRSGGTWMWVVVWRIGQIPQIHGGLNSTGSDDAIKNCSRASRPEVQSDGGDSDVVVKNDADARSNDCNANRNWFSEGLEIWGWEGSHRNWIVMDTKRLEAEACPLLRAQTRMGEMFAETVLDRRYLIDIGEGVAVGEEMRKVSSPIHVLIKDSSCVPVARAFGISLHKSDVKLTIACDDPLDDLIAKRLGFENSVLTSRQANTNSDATSSANDNDNVNNFEIPADITGRGTGPFLQKLGEDGNRRFRAIWLSYGGTQTLGEGKMGDVDSALELLECCATEGAAESRAIEECFLGLSVGYSSTQLPWQDFPIDYFLEVVQTASKKKGLHADGLWGVTFVVTRAYISMAFRITKSRIQTANSENDASENNASENEAILRPSSPKRLKVTSVDPAKMHQATTGPGVEKMDREKLATKASTSAETSKISKFPSQWSVIDDLSEWDVFRKKTPTPAAAKFQHVVKWLHSLGKSQTETNGVVSDGAASDTVNVGYGNINIFAHLASNPGQRVLLCEPGEFHVLPALQKSGAKVSRLRTVGTRESSVDQTLDGNRDDVTVVTVDVKGAVDLIAADQFDFVFLLDPGIETELLKTMVVEAKNGAGRGGEADEVKAGERKSGVLGGRETGRKVGFVVLLESQKWKRSGLADIVEVSDSLNITCESISYVAKHWTV